MGKKAKGKSGSLKKERRRKGNCIEDKKHGNGKKGRDQFSAKSITGSVKQ